MTRSWSFPGFQFEFGTGPRPSLPLLMGIVNATPDSFSDGGKYLAVEHAVKQAMTLVAAGAKLIDIGGESTRPGAEPVSLDEELSRVIPVVERLSKLTDVPISIDTYKADVAEQALRAGAKIVNDISGLTLDPGMLDVCIEQSCGVICMHMQGNPQTMQINPQYDNVVEEIVEDFDRRLQQFAEAGLPRERIVLDPGIGFGKTAQHNLEILTQVARLQQLGRPILIGHSRKRFLQKILGQTLDERSAGTIGISIGLAQQGVDILRIHDVASNRDALVAWKMTQPSLIDSNG